MTETQGIILNWLREEFPNVEWNTNHRHFTVHDNMVAGDIGGLTLLMFIEDKELTVDIWTKAPFKPSNKIREVQLSNPTSIDELKEVVKHTIKITTNPFLVKRN